ncbi:mRNA triphosphatase CET1 [Xylariaceae sp. FL0255]|nr:mRNA triphosphatase CET1 [Xylariaceae sp. FL0255]
MDLHAMLNTEGGGGDRSKGTRHPPPPPPPPPSISTSIPASSMPPAPATPIQAAHGFRDYSHSNHASPVSHPYEYHQNKHPPQSAAPYASPTSYHPSVGGGGAYSSQGRPSIPPLQPLSAHDPRSPGSATLSGPSPYRQTPTSSASASSSGYPFPPPASPQQRHQYHSYQQQQQQQQQQHRDSYGSQTPVTSVPPYQQQQPIPQTPPIGTPGGTQQYLQQRSLSIQSTPTPTSAHSQHPPYPIPYQKSPVVTHTAVPMHPEQQLRHQSPHQTNIRQSPALSYQQHPPSPYQTRNPSGSLCYQQPQQHKIVHPSPPPPPPASVRMPSIAHSAYDAESQRRSQSQQSRGDRERTLSVSPKTRVPSLPSSTDQDSSSTVTYPRPHHPNAMANSSEPQWDTIPAKRKIDDRDLRPDEMENPRQPPPPPKMNGHRAVPPQPPPRSSASPIMTRKRRVRHSTAPVWAQSGRKRTLGASRNYTYKYHQGSATPGSALANGTPSALIKSETLSRHASPEMARAATHPIKDEGNHAGNVPLASTAFPWEPSLENNKPMDVVYKSVADFLVFHALQGASFEELGARGAQFEIEAKLGTIIDKATNDRIELRSVRAGECVIAEDARVAFRSSMTESQHQFFNKYLNEQVQATHPQNPHAASRLSVKYVHRREKDTFFELPPTMRQRLPASMMNSMSPNQPLKVRVTYDQNQKPAQGARPQPIAMIVKSRVSDLHIHMPHLPLDCRISINIEWNWDGQVDEVEANQIMNKDRQPDRNKDRLSYRHGIYSIDLTQVTQATMGPQGQPGPPSKEHELEIELDSAVLCKQGQLLMQGLPSRFEDTVEGLLCNMRLLARKCPPPEG